MRKKGKQGFTLLEVIIVIIILAILASVAVPRILASVNRSRSAEAVKAFAAIRTEAEQCYIANNNSFANCATLVALGMTGYTPKHFGAPTFTSGVNILNVVMQNTFGGVASTMTMSINAATGAASIVGTGIFNTINQ